MGKLICEVNKHSYLQYVFLLLWIFIMVGVLLSPLDCLLDIVDLWRTYHVYLHQEFKCKAGSMRQVRYLVMLRKQNKLLLDKVIGLLERKNGVVDDDGQYSTPL